LAVRQNNWSFLASSHEVTQYHSYQTMSSFIIERRFTSADTHARLTSWLWKTLPQWVSKLVEKL